MKKDLNKRIEMVKAMETIMRSLNDEEIFEAWLMGGVADGDIKEDTEDEDIAYYCKDETFSELMNLFCRLMKRATSNGVTGALYCNGICS